MGAGQPLGSVWSGEAEAAAFTAFFLIRTPGHREKVPPATEQEHATDHWMTSFTRERNNQYLPWESFCAELGLDPFSYPHVPPALHTGAHASLSLWLLPPA